MGKPDPDDIERRAAEVLDGLELSPMDEGFTAMHVLFEALQEGGFTRYEALWLCGYMLCQGNNNLPEGGDDDPNS